MTKRPESCPLYLGKTEAAGNRNGINFTVKVLSQDSGTPGPNDGCVAERIISRKANGQFISFPCSTCGVRLWCRTHEQSR